jgi:hypothetical protein
MHCYLLDRSKVDDSVLNVARQGILMLANISFDDIIRANQACIGNPNVNECIGVYGGTDNISAARAMDLYEIRAMLAGAEVAMARVLMDERENNAYVRSYLTTVEKMVVRMLDVKGAVPEGLMKDLTTVGLQQYVLYRRPETPEPAEQEQDAGPDDAGSDDEEDAGDDDAGDDDARSDEYEDAQKSPSMLGRFGNAFTGAFRGAWNAIPWGPVDGYLNGQVSDDEDEDEDEDENEGEEEDDDDEIQKF